MHEVVPHPWNREPTAAPKFRLTVDRRGGPSSKALVATAPIMPMLLDLNVQLDALGYEFVKLERIIDDA